MAEAAISCTPLGAGQDVGKSCIIVRLPRGNGESSSKSREKQRDGRREGSSSSNSIKDATSKSSSDNKKSSKPSGSRDSNNSSRHGYFTIMFDCGLHMGASGLSRFPDFDAIPRRKGQSFTEAIDCVVITHFHLDHCGALPYFTQVCGYTGPVYMTHPTKLLAPLMLEDFRKVLVERKGEEELFTAAQIHSSIARATVIELHEEVQVRHGLVLKAFYAGHVLGAVMVHAASPLGSVLYTGDFSTAADHHLGAADVDRLRPDLVITESTYATTIRDSRRAREIEFLKKVHQCISSGGKVLIPVFAVGRAQELCLLLDEYWERVGLKAPIYFSAGLTSQANVYCRMLTSWANQNVQKSEVERNAFDFRHVSPLSDRSLLDSPSSCVLFATPGMLSGGLSLEVFKKWAPSASNLLIMPGYCVAGTVGSKVMAGEHHGGKRLDVDKRTHLEVNCQVHQLAFSPHTDSKGILDTIRQVAPRNVVLVHGDKPNMAKLKDKITRDFGLPCFMPANHETVTVPAQRGSESEEKTSAQCDDFWDRCSLPSIATTQKCPSPIGTTIEGSDPGAYGGSKSGLSLKEALKVLGEREDSELARMVAAAAEKQGKPSEVGKRRDEDPPSDAGLVRESVEGMTVGPDKKRKVDKA